MQSSNLGLYADLIIHSDYSNLHGRLIKFDGQQRSVLKKYAETKPKNVLIGGPFGSGKTLVLVQCISISISELETSNILFRVIVVIDMQNEDSRLLKDMQNIYLGFIGKEINIRRKKKGLQPIEVTFCTLKSLMIKHNIVPNTPKDLKVMKSLISQQPLLSENGWLYHEEYSQPTVSSAIFASTECDEKIDENDLLKKLNKER